jgi:hypothetical protein
MIPSRSRNAAAATGAVAESETASVTGHADSPPHRNVPGLTLCQQNSTHPGAERELGDPRWWLWDRRAPARHHKPGAATESASTKSDTIQTPPRPLSTVMALCIFAMDCLRVLCDATLRRCDGCDVLASLRRFSLAALGAFTQRGSRARESPDRAMRRASSSGRGRGRLRGNRPQ